MSRLDPMDTPVTAAHRFKLAYVYVRQSSVSQVTRHAESTEQQYRLVERAASLGWPADRIQVIDEDLGKSAVSADQRLGFQHLIAEIGLARVGLVVSLDASRLARNNRDWYQLLELCSVFGTLIADGERLYDPRDYHDRLVLGLSGIMSEAELHHLKLRLHAGARQKAERGELHQLLPVGLVRLATGEVGLHPDAEVQARLHLVFHQFTRLGSAKAVMRYCRQEGLLLPSRPRHDSAAYTITWHPARNSTILAILQNPAYAGAYVYGRRRYDPVQRIPGRPYTGRRRLPLDKWPVLLHNRYPAYISWETFLANQAQLRANQSRFAADQPGMPRQGQALLQGIVVCGRCGARMRLHYSGGHGTYPVYVCNSDHLQYGSPRCQEVRALALDAEVEQIMLGALAPDQVAIALAALEQLEAEDAALARQWALRLERARYEAERARRQYDAVEPENRLVGRTLERQWEAKLRAVEQVEEEAEAWRRQHQFVVTPADRQAILVLGADLPRLWQASSTTPADRKSILRLIIKAVRLDQQRAPGRLWFQITWQTGAQSEHWLTRHVRSFNDYAEAAHVEQRVRELHAAQKLDTEIAAILNAEELPTPRGKRFSSRVIWRLRQRWGLPTVKVDSPDALQWAHGTYSVAGAAHVLGVVPGTIYAWLRSGRLTGQQLAKGTPWIIPLTGEQIIGLRNNVKRIRRSNKEAS